jgi:hypothetical protein
MPFAAIGFASVVSMMPGVFLFRMASGLGQLTNSSERTWELMGATLADGWIAILIILAMSFGLIAPKLIIDYVSETRASGLIASLPPVFFVLALGYGAGKRNAFDVD